MFGLLAVVVALGLIAVSLAVASRHSRAATRPVDQSKPGPVLLVPGYGGSTSSLSLLAGRLRAAGRDAQVVSLQGNAQGDLTEQARVLSSAAEAARQRTGAASVDVVGYSAGGVVARIWLKNLDGASVVRRLVTLGSPQHGTALAALGSLVSGECPTACQQLVPTSDILTRLNAVPELPAGPAVVSLWSTKDEVVLPPDSAVLTGALNIQVQQVCADSTVNHGGLPADPLVDGLVLAELGPGPTSQFGPADCTRLRD